MSDPRPQDAAEAGLRIAHGLQAAGFDYALGGALALGAHGVPRGTLDVDVNVFVADEEIPDVIRCLQQLGVELEPQTSSVCSPCRDRRSTERTCVRGWST